MLRRGGGSAPTPLWTPRRPVLCLALACLLGLSWYQGLTSPSAKAARHVPGRCGGPGCAAVLGAPGNGSAPLAAALDGAMATAYRSCSEAAYRCGSATLVFVHVHKGGGTTFVSMARANGAGLARRERNGDPVDGGGGPSGRTAWWDLEPNAQRRWFSDLRNRDGVRFVATEKGFPRYATNLLAPANIVYAIVVRQPPKRFVSYYFWKYRDASLSGALRARARSALGGGRGVAALRPGAPTFEAFVEAEAPLDGYYVRRLLGIPPRETLVLDDAALDAATTVLESAFSLVLLTERLGELGPVVASTLGWRASNFADFHAKSNPAPDVALLAAWRADWADEIARRMPLDVRFYAAAAALCDGRLAAAAGRATAGDREVKVL